MPAWGRENKGEGETKVSVGKKNKKYNFYIN